MEGKKWLKNNSQQHASEQTKIIRASHSLCVRQREINNYEETGEEEEEEVVHIICDDGIQ